MKYLYSFLFLPATLTLCINSSLFGQQSSTIDSVSQALKAYTTEDTVKVEMLIDACVNATFSSNDITLT
jgi:hypothetical protein